MEARIHRAEQREFAALLRGVPTYSKPRRPDPANSPYTLLKVAATSAGIALTALRAVLNGKITLPVPAMSAAGPKQKPPTALHPVHWRRRNDLAAILLEAAQRKHHPADPAAAAAAWLIGELAVVLPTPETQLIKRWSPAEDALLRQHWAENVSIARLAAEFGVTRGAVLGRARRMALPRRHS